MRGIRQAEADAKEWAEGSAMRRKYDGKVEELVGILDRLQEY